MLAKIVSVLLVLIDMNREGDLAGSWCAAGKRGGSEGRKRGNAGKIGWQSRKGRSMAVKGRGVAVKGRSVECMDQGRH